MWSIDSLWSKEPFERTYPYMPTHMHPLKYTHTVRHTHTHTHTHTYTHTHTHTHTLTHTHTHMHTQIFTAPPHPNTHTGSKLGQLFASLTHLSGLGCGVVCFYGNHPTVYLLHALMEGVHALCQPYVDPRDPTLHHTLEVQTDPLAGQA